MSWLSKQLKKTTKILDPAGAKIREGTGGSYGDPLNWYDSGPKKPVPYQQTPNSTTLAPDPGTGGPTMKLGGGSGGRTYQDNPFAQQMAQVSAIRGGPPGMQTAQAPNAPRPASGMALALQPQARAVAAQALQQYQAQQPTAGPMMMGGGKGGPQMPAPQGQKVPSMMQIPTQPTNPMMFR